MKKNLEPVEIQGSADGGTRTRTPVKAEDFKSGQNHFQQDSELFKNDVQSLTIQGLKAHIHLYPLAYRNPIKMSE